MHRLRFCQLGILAISFLPAWSNDLDTLQARLRASFDAAASLPSATAAQKLMADMQADGTWPDIDYAAKDAAVWNPSNHLDRIAQLAKAYVTPKAALAGDAGLLAKFSLGLDAWIRINPKSSNWWWNEIGSQLKLAPSLYLMWPELTAGEKTGTDSLLARSWKSAARTGENLVWISKITLWRACLNRDSALAKTAVQSIAGTMILSTGEGMQPDYSFHQHGFQLYNGGYGSGYISDCAAMAALLGGTEYAYPNASVSLLADYLLQGDRWMEFGGNWDVSVRGREITRAGSASAGAIAGAASQVAALLPPAASPSGAGPAAELNALAADVRARTGSAVIGNRYFWASEYMAHHRAGYGVSVRMASQRMVASEVVNGEGLLSQYVADGAVLVYRTGREYDSIFPVWDWCRIPGVTAAHADAPPAMKSPAPGAGAFAGGVSDGQYGAAAFAYSKLGVQAEKAWFFFDREAVALGAGITAAGAAPIQTALNQCLLSGSVIAATGASDPPTQQTLAPGSPLTGTVRWIYHDGIAYVFPGGAANVGWSGGTVTGAWTRINTSQSSAPVSKPVFSLWFDHGPAPAGAAYAYIILAAGTADSAAAYAARPGVAVLANTPALQAVRHAGLGLTQAVFHDTSSLQVTPALSLAPDRACLLMAKESQDGLMLSVSDPARGTADLHVRANVKLTGSGAAWSPAAHSTLVTFKLPQGDSAGATASLAFATQGVSVRPDFPARSGLTLRAIAPASADGGRLLEFALPAAGPVAFRLEDAQGRILSRPNLGMQSAGTHRWTAPGGASVRIAELHWRDRSIALRLPGGRP